MEFILTDLVFWLTQLLKFATFSVVLVLVGQVASLLFRLHRHFVATRMAKQTLDELKSSIKEVVSHLEADVAKKNASAREGGAGGVGNSRNTLMGGGGGAGNRVVQLKVNKKSRARGRGNGSKR